jgi:hypothetical protein
MSANAEAIPVMHRALDLLGRASADWRNGGQCDGVSLHWPVAVSLARRELEQALGTMGDSPTSAPKTPGPAWLGLTTLRPPSACTGSRASDRPFQRMPGKPSIHGTRRDDAHPTQSRHYNRGVLANRRGITREENDVYAT